MQQPTMLMYSNVFWQLTAPLDVVPSHDGPLASSARELFSHAPSHCS